MKTICLKYKRNFLISKNSQSILILLKMNLNMIFKNLKRLFKAKIPILKYKQRNRLHQHTLKVLKI